MAKAGEESCHFGKKGNTAGEGNKPFVFPSTLKGTVTFSCQVLLYAQGRSDRLWVLASYPCDVFKEQVSKGANKHAADFRCRVERDMGCAKAVFA